MSAKLNKSRSLPSITVTIIQEKKASEKKKREKEKISMPSWDCPEKRGNKALLELQRKQAHGVVLRETSAEGSLIITLRLGQALLCRYKICS